MNLRDYQTDAIDKLRLSFRWGKMRPVVQMPTGAGKTIVAANIVRMALDKGKRVLFCVPAISLIDQSVEKFERNGNYHIGVIQAQHERTDRSAPVQVCSVQTLARRELPHADLVIIDECFVAGTKILAPDGERPIEDFRIGDRVVCATGEGHVIGVSKKLGRPMRLEFSNGRSVRVTTEHPFFTNRGWVKAKDLGVGSYVFSEEGLRSLWGAYGAKDISKRSAGIGNNLEQASILLNFLFKETCKPDEQERYSPEDARNIIADQARSYFSRRQRKAFAVATVGASSCIGRGVASGSCYPDENETGFWVSDELQAGYSQRTTKMGNRNRRSMSQWSAEAEGFKEGSVFADIRVESISFDERASDEPVFNLHIAGHPSYFAEGILVHNCHLMFKFYDIWMNLPEWKEVPFVGLTATPWAKGMGAEGRWDDLIIGTTTEELIRLGHLSDFKVYAPAHPDLDGVKIVAGDYKLDQLGDAMDKAPLVADIVSTWLARGQDRPTLVFAVNRAHAKHIEQQFQAAGVSTAYLDAFTDLEERSRIGKAFEAGDVRVVCNVGVLTTGVDWDVRCIILARPTRSEILYTQIIGRGLRTAEDKDYCLVLDHSDTTIKLGFVTDIIHDKLDDGRHKGSQKEKKQALPKECPKCAFLKPPKTKVCPSCGFEAKPVSDVETEDGELHEITRDGRVKVDKFTLDEKQRWYSELILHAHLRGYKRGWAYWAYKDKFKVAPAHTLDENPAQMLSPEVQSWITSRNIRKAKAREKTAVARFDAKHPD